MSSVTSEENKKNNKTDKPLDEPMEFEAITPLEVPVKIGDKKYLLKEAGAGIVAQYNNALMKATKFSSTGKMAGIDGIADAEPLLLSLCMFEWRQNPKTDKEEWCPCTIGQIRTWPNKIVRQLLERVKLISGITEVDEQTPEQIKLKIESLNEKLKEKEEGNELGKE